MKDIFDKVIQNVVDISQTVLEQTVTTVNQGKSELDLVQAKNELKKLYARLGERVYQNRLSPEEDSSLEMLYDLIAAKVAKVTELEACIKDMCEEQKSTMEELKRNMKKTWNGQEEPMTPEADDEGYVHMRFCNECNIGNHPDAEYCIACGSKLNNSEG